MGCGESECSNHLPCLAEAAAGPEDVVLVLVTTPVLVGGGSTASAVLCEGGGGFDVTGKEKKGSPKDVAALFSEDQCNFSGRIFSHAKYIFHTESSSLKQIAKNYGHFKN